MSLSGPLDGVQALLVDLEGTVSEAGRAVPGAAKALEELARRGIACGFVTNTTSRPRSALVGEISDKGIAAAALAERARLVTKDRHLRSSPILSTIW